MAVSAKVKSLVAKITKEYGEGSIVLGTDLVVPKRFPTGSLSLDIALGGGWPGNQWNEILGMESSGKALALDTPIPTPSGWTTMEKLQPGDQVFDEHGSPTQVLFTTDTQHNRQCYEVLFSDGSTLVADAEHQWTVIRKSDGGRREQITTTTQGLLDLGLRWGGNKGYRFHIPTTEPLKYEGSGSLPVPPYVLGAWLGDGTSASGGFTSADSEIVEEIREHGYLVHKHRDTTGFRPYGYGILGITEQLRTLGVLNNKHIPQEYLHASVEDRMSLLQGLMDTDGTSDQRGHLEFMTTNPRLGEEFYELTTGLGLKVHAGEGDATLSGRFISRKYRYTFQADFPAFRLTRKLERQSQQKLSSRNTFYHRGIVSITAVDSVPVKCIQVASANSLYLAGKACIPTHNTALTLKTIAANQEADPEFTTLWIAAEHYDVDQAEALGVDNSRVMVVPTQAMEMAYQTILEATASKEFDCVVLDSYPALVPAEEVNKDMDESVMAIGARLTGKFFRKVGESTRRSLTGDERPFLGLFINQYRDAIGQYSPMGTPKTSPGGKAKNYAFYTRIEVSRAEWIDESRPGKGKVRVGQTIKVKTVKNKSAAPQQVASMDFYFRDAPYLNFKRGEYDDVKMLATYAVLYDIVKRRGRYFDFQDTTWDSKAAFLQGVAEDLSIRAAITEAIMEATKYVDTLSITEEDVDNAESSGVKVVKKAGNDTD